MDFSLDLKLYSSYCNGVFNCCLSYLKFYRLRFLSNVHLFSDNVLAQWILSGSNPSDVLKMLNIRWYRYFTDYAFQDWQLWGSFCSSNFVKLGSKITKIMDICMKVFHFWTPCRCYQTDGIQPQLKMGLYIFHWDQRDHMPSFHVVWSTYIVWL